HDVVAGVADHGERRAAEVRGAVDRLDGRVEGTLAALGLVDGGGREGRQALDDGRVGPVDLRRHVDHGGTPFRGWGSAQRGDGGADGGGGVLQRRLGGGEGHAEVRAGSVGGARDR